VRFGMNPAKFVDQVAKPAKITISALTYAPFLHGFFAETFEVIRASLASIRATVKLPYDLLVFDNGSCAEVRDFLLDERAAGRIQYLILADRNYGKGRAWNMIFRGAPGEIIAYGDGDVLYKEGWLERSLELLESFPNAGMVSARPMRTDPQHYSSTLAWARAEPEVEVTEEQLLPWEILAGHELGLGRTPEQLEAQYAASRDVRLRYRGLCAYAGATHWQFVGRRAVLAAFEPHLGDKPLGDAAQLDDYINRSGRQRLMLADPLAVHLGNSLKDVPAALLQAAPARKAAPAERRWYDLKLLRSALLFVHDLIFRMYHRRP
jgi:glycosyltransferase involved in cell wall biosynthesis